MIIKEDDFWAEQITDGSTFWDLHLLKEKKKKSGAIVEEFGDPIYGIPLDSVMKRVCANRIARKHKGEALTMKQYLDEWKEQMKILKDLSLNENE